MRRRVLESRLHIGAGRPTVREDTMKIVVDFDPARATVCMQIAPDVFEVRDDDFLYVLNENPDESDRERMEECVQRCPKQAISIED